MKTSILLLITFLITGFSFAQKHIQIKDQVFEIVAVKEGKPVKVETRKLGLILNYETGDFLANIDIGDTRLNQEDEKEFMLLGDGILDIEGNIPINEIMQNQDSEQQYAYELSVRHLSADVEVLFTFHVNHIKITDSGISYFQMDGSINMLDFDVEDLMGYEPEVDLILLFQAIMVGD